MTQDRKYYGMTTQQIGLLAVLAAAACLLFAVAGFLVIRGGLGGPAAPLETPTPQSTATPYVLPSPIPTGTLTPIPYDQLIPAGWEQHKTALVELWLPPGFKPVDPKKLIVKSEGTKTLDLILQGSLSQTSLYVVVVAVFYEPITTGSLDAQVDKALAETPADYRLTERRKVLVNSTEVIRIVQETRLQGVDANQLTYAFQDGGTIWYVQYAAQINSFYEALDTFEKSVKTFRPVR